LHSKLVQENKPVTYVLVTNVEVNSQFRNTFISQCKSEEPSIKHYQVIGLDELVSWIEMLPELRHLYFPTIFGQPRFDLRIKIAYSFTMNYYEEELGNLLAIDVLNVGIVPSYLNANSIVFIFNIDGQTESIKLIYVDNPAINHMNPNPGALEPGKKQTYFYPLSHFAEIKQKGNNIFPVEIQVHDEIGNVYSEKVGEELRNTMIKYIYGK
jgi:hypothetical protein